MISHSSKTVGGFLCVLVLSLFMYVPGYEKPAALFWDENFHIASAQRYLNGVFFMEPHPPLGKLFIAAGEALYGANARNDQFASQEKADELPEHFSFAGYRLIPVLCAAAVAPLLYLVLYLLTGSPAVSLLIGILPALDNAFIVHNRGAMLEAPQLAFILLSFLAYLRAREDSKKSSLWAIVLGVACAGSMCIKINSAPVLLLPLALLLETRQYGRWTCNFLIPCILTALVIWQIHFFIGSKIEATLDGAGYFGISKEFEEVVRAHNAWKPQYLLASIVEAFHFTARYQKGVPELDYCKDEENGSTPLLWPIGSRAINYRWEDAGERTRYLYLVANPATWGAGIAGVLASITILLFRVAGVRKKRDEDLPLALFLIMYLGAWLSPLMMHRVFYLYHYFLPLLISWILFGISLSYLSFRTFRLVSGATFILSSASFVWLKPFTYYEPLSRSDFKFRQGPSWWDIRCKDCQSIFLQRCDGVGKNAKRTDPSWQLSIGNLQANHIEQSTGTPLQNASVLEVITQSRIQFPLNKKIRRVRGVAKVAADNQDQLIEFKILANGNIIWSATLSRETETEKAFDLNLAEYSVLILSAKNESIEANASSVMWEMNEVEFASNSDSQSGETGIK